MDDEINLDKDTCKKCGKKIGGRSFYVIEMDCIYDGESLSGCEKAVVCSDCHRALLHWFND